MATHRTRSSEDQIRVTNNDGPEPFLHGVDVIGWVALFMRIIIQSDHLQHLGCESRPSNSGTGSGTVFALIRCVCCCLTITRRYCTRTCYDFLLQDYLEVGNKRGMIMIAGRHLYEDLIRGKQLHCLRERMRQGVWVASVLVLCWSVSDDPINQIESR